jgi:quinol monooxygenase YgiN
MKRIHATMTIRVSPEREMEAMETLGSMIEQIRHEPGCKDCRLFRSCRSPDTIMFEQSWSNEEDLLRHIRSDRYTRILLVLEMSTVQPIVQFEYITRSRGMEFICFARGQPSETSETDAVGSQ